MTDKEQIIIDGVDVSGCEFYNPYYCGMYIDGYGDSEGVCRDYEDCYYKQLARKTEMYNKAKEDLGLLNGKLVAKTQECEKLRNALKEIEGEIKKYQCDNCEEFHCDSCDMKDILDIISKAKEEENAR